LGIIKQQILSVQDSFQTICTRLQTVGKQFGIEAEGTGYCLAGFKAHRVFSRAFGNAPKQRTVAYALDGVVNDDLVADFVRPAAGSDTEPNIPGPRTA
jgi:hypothetical protein